MVDETARRAAFRADRDGTGKTREPGMMSQAGYESSRMWEVSSEMLATARVDGYLQQVNPRWTEVLGWSSAELLSRPYLEFVHPDDVERTRIEASQLGKSGYQSVAFENRYQCRDGSYRWLLWNCISSSEDQLIYAAAHDETERRQQDVAIKATGEALMLLTDQLEERVEQRTCELASANKELEAFSYSVSHDLRAPLRAIDGFSQAVIEDYGEELPAGAKDDLERVRGASQRMATMIDEMLALSRITRSEMRREPVDLSTLAESVVDELRVLEPDREVQMKIERNLSAIGDSSLLRQVVHNLFENAWKFTSHIEHPCVELSLVSVDGDRTTFVVRDNGAGFDMRYEEKLFRPFERLHRQDEFPGTGVGLTTVARILNRHGGRIWAEGSPGEGASFFFDLQTGGDPNA